MNADLTEIGNLLREKAQIDKLISNMDEQKKRIRAYCLSALTDIKDNLGAILKVISDNLYLFSQNKYKEFYMNGKNERELVLFRYYNDVLEIKTNAQYVDLNNNQCTAEACMGFFYCGMKDVENRISDISTATSKGVEWWIDAKKRVDCGKKWIETVIRITKEHFARIVDERRAQMESVLQSASKEYEKIVA